MTLKIQNGQSYAYCTNLYGNIHHDEKKVKIVNKIHSFFLMRPNQARFNWVLRAISGHVIQVLLYKKVCTGKGILPREDKCMKNWPVAIGCM